VIPKISIITATYNSAATVRDTLLAVSVQDYPNKEHIIVDGLSTDNTLDIVKGFAHVSTVISEKDKGIYDAMNKGVAAATGDVVGILNSDDIYVHTRVLSTVMKAFSNPGVDVVYADLQYVRADNLHKVTRTWKSGHYSKKKFFYGWMPPHPTLFVRKKVYETVGNFNLALKSAADYEFMLRVLVKYDHRVHYIPEVIVKMRTGGISNATFRNRIRANREDREAWRLNDMRPYFFTIPFKPLRKVFQFINK
jgi:glycosyltransferase involved in cell wall biosynthesis